MITLIVAYRPIGPDGRKLELATAKKVKQELQDVFNRVEGTQYQSREGFIYTEEMLIGQQVFFSDGTKLLVAGRE